MSIPPLPVVFEPLYKPKPWGGRRLATLFDKSLPGEEPIGESWELVSLPENESHVRGGPLAGRTLAELVERWGPGLLGGVPLIDDRFPLLIKFLDACEHLSVQVHPKPAGDTTAFQPGVKHEAWFVLHAEPGAQLFIGLQPGVGPEEVARVANTPRMVDVLRVWEGRPGQCYYLPSGTLHALGAGLVVAEVQTPSDITYRAYDWDRVGMDGQPRELHVEQALRNIRYDVTEEMILQPRARRAGALAPVTRVATCERFVMDLVRLDAGFSQVVPPGQMRVWMVLSGSGRLTGDHNECAFAKGDVVLIPADSRETQVELKTACEWIEVTIPGMRG
ncbi:MAG: class I mannose-6-phosphate isomerase [Phycisphaerae bacterium]|nr:class I mannose-6-phosphate isomerase [Phycisphaerae bacterium]